MKGAGKVLHKAIYDLLTQDIELMKLVNDVGDTVKSKTKYPYITIQPDNSDPDDTHDRKGEQTDYLFNIYDDSGGWAKPFTIRDILIDLIDNQALPPQNGFSISRIGEIEGVSYFIEEEGDIFHVVVEAKFFIKEV